jgi:hypothetical protein
MARKRIPIRLDPRLLVALIALLVAVLGLVPQWVPFLEDRPRLVTWLAGPLRWLRAWWQVLLSVGLLVLIGYLAWWCRRKVAKALKLCHWWVLWVMVERDLRSSIAGLSDMGAEVLAATLRLGERRQDRRLFLSIPEAEHLVRQSRRPPQAGVGGTAWAKKGCEELRRSGLVERFADARSYEYMIWLEPRVPKSRAAGKMVHIVEGMLARRGWWRW